MGQAMQAYSVPCWWVVWWLWRAGCISQDTYLLYFIWGTTAMWHWIWCQTCIVLTMLTKSTAVERDFTFQIVGQCCEMYERCWFIYNLMNCFFNPIKTSVSKDGGWVCVVKSVLPFSKLIIRKSQVFQRACTCICRETRKYVAGVPRPSRVDISCMSKVSGPLFLYQSYHLNNQGGRTKRGHTFESLEPNLQNLTMHRNFFQPLLRSIK